MMDKANGLIDGEKFSPKRYTVKEIGDKFHSARLAAMGLGELHGEAMLPRDAEIAAVTQLVGIVERDGDLSELIEIDEVSEFKLTRADFASGDWVFVLAQGPELFKLRFR